MSLIPPAIQFLRRKLARGNAAGAPLLRSTAEPAWQPHWRRKRLPSPDGRSAAEELDVALWLEERGGELGCFYILFTGKGISHGQGCVERAWQWEHLLQGKGSPYAAGDLKRGDPRPRSRCRYTSNAGKSTPRKGYRLASKQFHCCCLSLFSTTIS